MENKSGTQKKFPLGASVLLAIFLYPLGVFATFLPRKYELLIGPYLGLIFLKISKRRRVALENIKKCFPEKSDSQCVELLCENYKHYGVLFLELLHMFSPFKNHYRNYAKKITILHGFENWKKAYDEKKGVLFVSSHLGNWEMLVACGGLANMSLTMVTKHLKPEWLHQKIQDARLSVGVSAAYEPRTMPLALRALREGRSVGFVVDQYAGPPIGIPVLFFGAKVGTLRAVGKLAERTGAKVVPVKVCRKEDGKIHVYVEPMLHFSEIAEDEEKNTQYLASKVEEWVRDNPEQWLWIHRRFKNAVWPS